MILLPPASFICCPIIPTIILNKGSLSPPTLLAQLFTPFYQPCHQYYHISVFHLALLSRKHHFLDSCRSPSVDDSPSILEDRPRGPCALDPSPSVVKCLRTNLGGVIIASPNGCFSHAQLQHLDRIIENRTGFISLPLFIEDPRFPLTLAHW